MKVKHLCATISLLAIAAFARADEGMWLPSLLNKIGGNQLKELGAQITPEDIYSINNSSLKDAIIALDHGSCTGEIVSEEGLFLTNYHCGYGEIQEHSSTEHNYLRDGFWAATREEELPNPGKSVTFLIRVEDVTDQVMASLNEEMDESVRQDSIMAVSRRIEDKALNEDKESYYETKVRSMFNSNTFLLFITQTFYDVRLVGAPSRSMGKFGGDTDNWMWPRHTCDFSMFRIYTAPNGDPADYSKDNVPLKSKKYLSISLNGYEKGDFAMVMGYPGSTDRYLTSEGVANTMKVINGIRIDVREKKLDIIRDYMATSEAATIQYASKYARSSNYYKYSIGQNKGLEHLNIIQKKKDEENKFEQWVNQSDSRMAKYGKALELINDAYSRSDDDVAFYYLMESTFSGPELFLYAYRFSGLLSLLEKGTTQNTLDEASRLMDGVDLFYKDFDLATDQKLAAELTRLYVQRTPDKYHHQYIETINKKYKGNYEAWAKAIFSKSIFRDGETLKKFLEDPKEKTLASDPVYMVSSMAYKISRNMVEEGRSDDSNRDKGYRLYMEGLMEMEADRNFYPNANSTMRVSFGTVGDYSPADAVHYNYFTTLKGYIEKEIPGDREFDVWPKMKELYLAKDFGQYADKDGEIHTCFTTNNDITGGNSGSPVLNGKGELIGLAFDGNWEAMSGDIAFENELQKCINVDIRFVLWTIDKVAGAKHLVDEMKIVK